MTATRLPVEYLNRLARYFPTNCQITAEAMRPHTELWEELETELEILTVLGTGDALVHDRKDHTIYIGGSDWRYMISVQFDNLVETLLKPQYMPKKAWQGASFYPMSLKITVHYQEENFEIFTAWGYGDLNHFAVANATAHEDDNQELWLHGRAALVIPTIMNEKPITLAEVTVSYEHIVNKLLRNQYI